jgi:tRNA-modifying protein YgfZ
MDTKVSYAAAQLRHQGVLSCTGDDARGFLHNQLTSDIESLPAHAARRAGWCSAKGRLLATFLVVPEAHGFLLVLPRELAPAVAKRLSMYVLRARVKLADASDGWTPFGVWGDSAADRIAALDLPVPGGELQVAGSEAGLVVQVASQRYLLLAPSARQDRLAGLAVADEQAWVLQEIRAGRPQIVQATQEQFVPQMVNLERVGGVDFNKGCYPGQEIVARTQYRGTLKRRMVRARIAAAAAAGDELFSDDLPGQASGVVANAAALGDGGSEVLAVVQIGSVEGAHAIHLRAADGPALELQPLPYA